MTAGAHWVDRAACRGVDPEVFHAKTAAGQLHAITTWCLACPVRAECLADALDLGADKDYGVRGGTTRLQRLALRKRPHLPTGQSAAAVAELRQLLDEEQPNYRSTPLPAPRPRRRARKEKTAVYEKPAPTQAAEPEPTAVEPEQSAAVEPEPTPAEPEPAPVRSISDLLTWAEQHPEATIRKHAKAARTALGAIQHRHAADTELERVQREADELRQRLAELDTRAKQLKAPAKAKRDYDPATVRAWAWERGLECPKHGIVSAAIVAAWRERAA